MRSLTRIAECALVAWLAASAFALVGTIAADETVDIDLRVVDPNGQPIAHPGVRFVPRERGAPTLEFSMPEAIRLPFPAIGRMTLSADGFVDRTFDVALARADEARIAGATISLDPARPIPLRVDSFIAGTVALPVGADRRKLRFDSPSAILLDGRSSLPVPVSTTSLAVYHSEVGLAFASLPEGDEPVDLTIAGREIEIDCRPGADWLITNPIEVRITVDRVEASFLFSRPGVHGLRVPSGIDLRIQCDAPGAIRFDRTLPASDEVVKVDLDLTPLPLAFARVEARDAVTRESVPIEALAVGRARANDRDRMDFAPEWNTLTLERGGSFLVAAPRGGNDLLVTTKTHYQTVLRRAGFEGTRDAPTPIVISVERSLPIQGVVIDATSKLGVADARITLRKTSRDLDDLPFAWKANGSVGFLSRSNTRKDGRYTLESTVWEDVTLEVEAEGYAPAWLGPIERKRALDLTIELHRGHRVAGTATKFSPGELAYLVDERSNRVLRAPIDAFGKYVFPRVAPGNYRGHIGADDRAWALGARGSEGTQLFEQLHDPRGSLSQRLAVTSDLDAVELPHIEIDEK